MTCTDNSKENISSSVRKYNFCLNSIFIKFMERPAIRTDASFLLTQLKLELLVNYSAVSTGSYQQWSRKSGTDNKTTSEGGGLKFVLLREWKSSSSVSCIKLNHATGPLLRWWLNYMDKFHQWKCISISHRYISTKTPLNIVTTQDTKPYYLFVGVRAPGPGFKPN